MNAATIIVYYEIAKNIDTYLNYIRKLNIKIIVSAIVLSFLTLAYLVAVNKTVRPSFIILPMIAALLFRKTKTHVLMFIVFLSSFPYLLMTTKLSNVLNFKYIGYFDNKFSATKNALHEIQKKNNLVGPFLIEKQDAGAPCTRVTFPHDPWMGAVGSALNIRILSGSANSHDLRIYLTYTKLCNPKLPLTHEFAEPYAYPKNFICNDERMYARYYDAGIFGESCVIQLRKDIDKNDDRSAKKNLEKCLANAKINKKYPYIVSSAQKFSFYDSPLEELNDLPKNLQTNTVSVLANANSIQRGGGPIPVRLVLAPQKLTEKIIFAIEASTALAPKFTNLGSASLSLQEFKNGFRHWQGTCARPYECIVILKENFDPRWKAILNGEAVKFFRVNFNQIALAVSPGVLDLVLRWSPKLWE